MLNAWNNNNNKNIINRNKNVLYINLQKKYRYDWPQYTSYSKSRTDTIVLVNSLKVF